MDQQKIVQYAQTSFLGVQQQLQRCVGIQASYLPQWEIILFSWLAYLHDVINFTFFARIKQK